MAGEMMSLSINKEMLTPVIENHVKTLMAEAMGGKDQIVDKVIRSVLLMKVDDRGNPCTYSSAKTLFEWMLEDTIKTKIRELIKEEIESNSGVIKENIRKQLMSKDGSNKFAKEILEAFAKTITNDWRTTFNVQIQAPSNRD